MNWLAKLSFSWREALDILLVALIFYRIILLVRGTRAVSVIHGIVVVLVAYYLSGEFGLHTLHWLMGSFLSSFFLVVVILFQTDIRKALSEVGLRWFGGSKKAALDHDAARDLADALMELARRRIGALVVLERGVPLGDVAAKGVALSTKLSMEMLLTFFNTETPLHDGAVLVRGDEITAVACILPLAGHQALRASMGTRHRAAIGITEDTDALALVVSEERGVVSAAEDGQLSEPLDADQLSRLLSQKWVNRR